MKSMTPQRQENFDMYNEYFVADYGENWAANISFCGLDEMSYLGGGSLAEMGMVDGTYDYGMLTSVKKAVSYTHLHRIDIFPGKVAVRVFVQKLIGKIQCGEGAGPVSYTHLDVYKRQIIGCLRIHAALDRITGGQSYCRDKEIFPVS